MGYLYETLPFNDCAGNVVVTAAVVEEHKSSKLKMTLKLNCKFDSMTLLLFTPNENSVMHVHAHTHTLSCCPYWMCSNPAVPLVQLLSLDPHHEQLKLAEFTLGTISTSVHMFSDNSMKASVKLDTCLLDDKRPNVQMVTPR